jgi:two-component system response regulator RegA
MLAPHGFAVTAVAGGRAALDRAGVQDFAYGVLEMRLADGNGIDLIGRLQGLQPRMRIVIITDIASFASVVRALQAGAADYLGKPVVARDLLDALLDRRSPLPKVPDTPLGLHRVCWEYIQRIHEQCGRNVSETARRLGMHRRSLQRILSKRAPPARGAGDLSRA